MKRWRSRAKSSGNTTGLAKSNLTVPPSIAVQALCRVRHIVVREGPDACGSRRRALPFQSWGATGTPITLLHKQIHPVHNVDAGPRGKRIVATPEAALAGERLSP